MKQCQEQISLFSAEASRDCASPFLQPGSAEARRTTVTSGLKCSALCRNCGPLGSLARMLLGSSAWRSTRCLLTWKVSATPARRLLFRLVPSTPRTGGTDARSWLWKTPIASDASNRLFYVDSRGEPNLSAQVKLWPTPKASDYKGSGPPGSTSAEHDLHKGNLKGAVMYATPQARDYRTGQAERWQDPEKTRDLNNQVGGQLNPDWVEALMGFPTGWTDLED